MAKVVLIGGSGFVGKALCEAFIANGDHVTSVSFHGKPQKIIPILAESAHMHWVQGDLFLAGDWKKELENCTVLVHLVGILWEDKREQLTYERMIVESARIVAQAANEAKISKVVFLSAQTGPPIIGKKYLESKRKAEQIFQAKNSQTMIFRPFLLYGVERPSSVKQAKLFKFAQGVPILSIMVKKYQPEEVHSFAKKAVALIMEQRK